MNDAKFYNSFDFRLISHNRYYTTDQTRGCPHHYFARMIRGTAKIISDGDALHLKAGDIFYIPNGLPYRSYWYPDEHGEVLFYSFGFDYLPDDRHTYRLQTVIGTEPAQTLFAELESVLTVCPASIGLLYHFFGAVAAQMKTQAVTRSKTVDRALRFMRENDIYTVRDIAKYCGISESGLYAAFKKHLGETPVEVRHHLWAEKATELLTSTDLSIEEISNRLGFSSSSYFRKVFKKQTGHAPSAVRKSVKTI